MRFLNILGTISQKLIVLLLMLILTFVLFPLVFIIWLPTLIIRKTVSCVSKLIRPDLGKILKSTSSCFAPDYFLAKPCNTLGVHARLKGSVDIEKIKSRFVNNVIGIQKVDGDLRNIELKQYPYKWMGFVFWKWDENFDISNHVKYYQDGTNNETKLTAAHIAEIEHSLTFKNFPEKRSPWELIIIPNVQSESGEEEAICLIRFHHIICDASSMLKLLCFDIMETSKENVPHTHFPKQTFFQKLLFSLKFMKLPYDIAENLVETYDINDWVIPQKQLSEKCISVVSDKISMDIVRDAKHAWNTSANAVILSALTAAMRNAMLKKNGRVPKNIHSGVAFPAKGHPDKLRNYAVVAAVALPVGERDPVLRLRKTEKILDKVKNSTIPFANYVILTVAGCLFHWMLSFLFNNNPLKLTIIGATFPGPKTMMNFFGADATDCHYSSGPLFPSCGIAFATFTYNNCFKVRLMANEKMLDKKSDVEEMIQNLVQEFSVLKCRAKSNV